MNFIKLLFIIILSGIFINGYADITSAKTGVWNDPLTWVGNVVPDLSANVIIAATHTVTVNVESSCKDISFLATTSKLIMSANLNCYGNVNRFDNLTSNHFTSWTAGAKFKFIGDAPTQTITNLGTSSSSPNWPFRMNEIVIDKVSGKFVTSLLGGNYKLGIGTSLEVVRGTFEMSSTDDIEGRDISATATTPAIIVRAGALFNMLGSSSCIRRGNFITEEAEKIGKMTIYGEAYLATSTTDKISFTNIDIESGGILYIPTSRGWAVNCFNPGTVTVKNGGLFRNSLSINIWYTNTTTPTTMDLQDGGTFGAYSGTTYFPPNFTNNGRVRYALSTADQTITDVDYSTLELSYPSSGTYKKNWTLGANRVISDSLETNNSAGLVLSAASTRNLTINGTLRLTSGSIDNSNPNVNLIIGSGAEISKATGTISNSPAFSGVINLKYSSSGLVTTGSEMPSGAGVLNNLSITGSGGIVLTSSPTVNGTLSISGGKITLGSNNLTVVGSITGAGSSNYVVTDGSGGLIRNVSSGEISFPVGFTDSFTPVVLNNSGTADNFTVKVKNTFDNSPTSLAVVNKQWTISEVGTGANVIVKFQWNKTDENVLFVRTNPVLIGRFNGTVWEGTSASYTAVNDSVFTASAGDFTAFSPFTVGNEPALPVELSTFSSYLNGRDVLLKWETKTEINSNKFEIERSLNNLAWINIGSVKAHVLSNSPKQYSYIDKNLQKGRYEYRLKMIDNDGSGQYSKIVETEISVPKNFSLSQNYPNPFNPETNIRFEIPKESNVNISIFNIMGEKVATLLNEYMEPGYYQRSFYSNNNGVNLSSGTYFYVLKAGENNLVKKMILIK